jgi:putative peptidoglycan lipid II flippase
MSEPVRQIGRNFLPVTISRGAVQITAYIDQYIASWLPTGAVTGLFNAQLLYTLPVSLFGISISAAQLPALSGDATRDGLEPFRERINTNLQRLAFFIVPSAVAFLALGDVIAGAVLQTGKFRVQDSQYVWGILAGSAIGLLATTMARLYSVAHYALGDTKRPLQFAMVRLIIAGGLGYLGALYAPAWLGLEPQWGAAGLTASAGVAGWTEFALLRSSLNRRIGRTGLAPSYLMRLWIAGLVAAPVALATKVALPPLHPIVRGAIVLPVFGALFLGVALLFRLTIPGLRR